MENTDKNIEANFNSNYFKPSDFNTPITPDFKLNPNIQTGKYGKIHQDDAINALSLISSKTKADVDQVTGTGLIDISSEKLTLEILVKQYGSITLKQSTSKLLTYFNMEFTENGAKSSTIIKPLKEVAEALGLSNLNKARESICKDLDALAKITLHSKRKYGETLNLNICSGNFIKNSMVYFNFTPEIASYLEKLKIMPIDKKLLQAQSNSQKNPYLWPLGLKISQIMKIKMYDNTKHSKTEACIISVSKLLEVCQKYGMPTYEQVNATSRRPDAQIIKPFERDLDLCASLGVFKWEYCKAKGELLTDEELENTTFKEYIKRYIKVTYPEDYLREEYKEAKAFMKEKEAKKKAKRYKKKSA